MKKFFLLFCGVLGILVFAGTTRPVSALSLSPTVLDFQGVKGGTVTHSVHLKNELSIPVTISSGMYAVASQNEQGFPRIVQLSDDSPLKKWISFASGEKMSLAAREERDVPISVTIPQSAAAGGYYAVVVWNTESEQGVIGLSPSPGVNVAITVPGPVTEKAHIYQFSIVSKKGFWLLIPITFSVKVINDGGIHFFPEGMIEVKNIFGSVIAREPIRAQKDLVAGGVPQEHPNGRVLPGEARELYGTWGKGFALGFYTATVTLDLQGAGSPSVQKTFFVMSPILLYVLYALISLCIVWLLRFMVTIIRVFRIKK